MLRLLVRHRCPKDALSVGEVAPPFSLISHLIASLYGGQLSPDSHDNGNKQVSSWDSCLNSPIQRLREKLCVCARARALRKKV